VQVGLLFVCVCVCVWVGLQWGGMLIFLGFFSLWLQLVDGLVVLQEGSPWGEWHSQLFVFCSLQCFLTPPLCPLGLHHYSFSVSSLTPPRTVSLWLLQDHGHTPVFLSLSLSLDFFLWHANMSWQNLVLQINPSPRSAAAGSLLHLHSALWRGGLVVGILLHCRCGLWEVVE